ncbi:MAG: response regulator [Anaerolineae bacterium]|jgi:two-component system response regulator|nr:response regulator [Anaerolineae bacterium]
MPNKKIILLVEDNPDDVDLTLRAFKRSPIPTEIVVTRDGVEALDYLFMRGAFAQREAGLPQVVLLDLKLPKVDGLEVLHQIRAHPSTRLLPVVMLTSSNEQEDLLKSYNRGANSYIRKPVDFNKFMESVQQLGIYWLMMNQNPPNAGS